jgi:hypothetical protein
LRTLRAQSAEQAAQTAQTARAAQPTDVVPEAFANEFVPAGGPPKLSISTGLGSARRRFMVPLVAVVAFGAGVAAMLIVSAQLARTDNDVVPYAVTDSAPRATPVATFDNPSLFPNLAEPALGDQFVADSLRNISGTTQEEQGYGAFLAREVTTGSYCLIVNPDTGVSEFTCATADELVLRGLTVTSTVTVRSPGNDAAASVPTNFNVKLSRLGAVSMWFSSTTS